MSGGSPSSIKSFYKAKIHNSSSNNSKSSSKRSLDSNNNISVKISRTIDCVDDVITLADSEDEDSNEIALIRRVSTPCPGALPFGAEPTFNTPKESNLLKIFFLNSQNSDRLRSAYNSLSCEVFNPCWIDLSEIDKMMETHKNPILVLDSFDSDEYFRLKSNKGLKIFSAFALLSINPRGPWDLTSFKYPRIASICMKQVNVTISGIKNEPWREILKKIRAMGATFQAGLKASTTHIIATQWNSEKVRCFRKANKLVMRPEWVHRCWELRENIRDLGELNEFALPVFAGMNICVSGFDQYTRTNMRKNVEENGGKWQRGLMLDRYDFDTGESVSSQIDKDQKTTHLVVKDKIGDKYITAMNDPDVKIVNIDWFNVSLITRVPQMEDDPKYCCRDNNALNELKRARREMMKRQLQSCSQIDPIQDISLPVLPPKKDVFNSIDSIADVCSTMISSTAVFDGLSFCFCGLSPQYHKSTEKIISHFGGTIYNELVSAVTHVIIGTNMTSHDAYSINQHEAKYRRIEKVDLNWVVKCVDNRTLFPTLIDVEFEKFLDRFKCTQDLPPNEARKIAYARALERADEFSKELDIAEKLNHSINFYNNKTNNGHKSSQNAARISAIPDSPKLEITKNRQRTCSADIMQSIPVGWGSQN